MTDERLARTEELLCDEILWGCSADEAPELRAALRDPVTRHEAASLEWTAAAITAALATADFEEPPAHLKARLEQTAVGFLMERRGLSLRDIGSAIDGLPAAADRRNSGRVVRGPWLSNLVGAAALIVAAVLFFTRERAPEAVPVAQQRAALLRTASDLVRMDWKGEGVAGDVCWSDTKQCGFMRFRGLDANDPRKFQYQLWIFDRGREDTTDHPVDGGVFDVDESGEILVPIRTSLRVHDAFAFAVTVERPGGVVVSAKDQIVSTAGL